LLRLWWLGDVGLDGLVEVFPPNVVLNFGLGHQLALFSGDFGESRQEELGTSFDVMKGPFLPAPPGYFLVYFDLRLDLCLSFCLPLYVLILLLIFVHKSNFSKFVQSSDILKRGLLGIPFKDISSGLLPLYFVLVLLAFFLDLFDFLFEFEGFGAALISGGGEFLFDLEDEELLFFDGPF
jgi:hypothetical protein